MQEEFKIFDDNLLLYESMLDDIHKSKQSVWIEVFRFNKDAMGEKFRSLLYDKLQEGIEVKLLVDAWGTGRDETFFEPLIKAGAEVRIYRKMKFGKAFLAKNHCRNHRKLIIIDSEIAYIGSSNISAYCLNWRECNIRIKNDDLLTIFRRSFKDSFRSFERYSFKNIGSKRHLHSGEWVFIQDFPNIYRQKIKTKYERMLSQAKSEIIIESPYFLPGHNLRKKLTEAAQRGVNTIVVMPKHSDVRFVDIIRRHFLGILHEAGVKIYFYTQSNLHSKGLMIDNQIFSISSANFDYRSFRYQYELALIGKEKAIIPQLRQHFDSTLKHCTSFNYQEWKKRSFFQRISEVILLPFRYLF
jgi:cardiolipin synthase